MNITDKLAFISPCIAKRDEIKDPKNKGYVSYNITFDHLIKYASKHNIKAEPAANEIEYGLGSIYPIPGGLKEKCILVLRRGCICTPDRRRKACISFS